MELVGAYSNLFRTADTLRELLELVPSGGTSVLRSTKQVQRRLSASELEEFSTIYQAGSSIREIAQYFKIHRTTVHAHVEALGLLHRDPRLTPADIKEAAEMYQSGKSLIAVAGHFGVAGDTVALALRKAGVEIRKRRGAY